MCQNGQLTQSSECARFLHWSWPSLLWGQSHLHTGNTGHSPGTWSYWKDKWKQPLLYILPSKSPVIIIFYKWKQPYKMYCLQNHWYMVENLNVIIFYMHCDNSTLKLKHTMLCALSVFPLWTDICKIWYVPLTALDQLSNPPSQVCSFHQWWSFAYRFH